MTTTPKGHVEVTRTLGIDMGHRVPGHEGKCVNLHGHRYHIEVTASALEVQASGSGEGMITDFGVLKTAMVVQIEDVFDHALCLSIDDPLVEEWGGAGKLNYAGRNMARPELIAVFKNYAKVNDAGSRAIRAHVHRVGVVVVVPTIPTAEALAHIWYTRVDHAVRHATKHKVWLTKVRVYETPNCWAEYIPPAHVRRRYGKRAEGTA